MEVSVSFTGGEEPPDPAGYYEEESVLGRVFIPREGVITSGDIAVRYEKHPWLEAFELDGIRAAPARRAGIGTKDAAGYVRSLSTIYAPAYDEYYEYGGDTDFDAQGYFAHAAEHFISIAGSPEKAGLYRRFAGFAENMWREGDQQMLDVALGTVVPLIMADQDARELFENTVTEEFREYMRENNKN